MELRRQVTAALIGAAVALPAIVDGGLSTTSQNLLLAGAGAALLAALWTDDAAVWRALRSPAILALVALAVLAAASAAWTVADADDALDRAKVLASLAALAIAAAAIVGPRGVHRTAALTLGGIVVVASLGLVIAGMAGVTFRTEPLAERIVRTWRPLSTVEFAPAVALLSVFALGPLAWAMLRAPLRWAAAAAGAAALAAAALYLGDTRLELALGLAVLGGIVATAWREPGLRLPALVMVALLAGSALGIAAIEGGEVGGNTEGDAGRALGVLGAAVAVALLWLAVRRAAATAGASAPGRGAIAAMAALALALAIPAFVSSLDEPSGAGNPDFSDPSHGRVDQWSAAIEVWADEPLLGAGAEAFFIASIEEQDGSPVRFAHNTILESAAELGLAGLLAALALYAATAAALWRLRRDSALWLLAPTAGGFLISNLFGITWHIPAVAAIWSVALGATIAQAQQRGRG